MLSVERIPTYRKIDKHLWADYIELNCIFSKDKEYTGVDLSDNLFLAVQDTNIDFDWSESNPNSTEYVYQTPAVRDKHELFISDIFRILSYRAKTYSYSYPFKISDQKVSFERNLNVDNYLYVYLLICSHLSFVSRDKWATLTSDFEYVSYYSLKECLPARAIVKIFGTSKSIEDSHYLGNTYSKIVTLANDLNEILLAKEDDFAPTANKDKGLDLVAWLPFNDKQNSRLVCFGQCKCSDEWPGSRFSSSQSQWKNWIHFNNPLNNFAFVPYCYRRTNGEWFDSSSVGDTIIVDRQRIIDLLHKSSEFNFDHLRSSQMIQDWIL